MNDQTSLSWQILLPGIPITSNRGALGWSSVTLVQTAGYKLLVDTGSYGDRSLLLKCLGEAGLRPDEINAVFLTHFHYDHMMNFDLFANAMFHLAEEEIDYVTGGGYLKANDPFVPAPCYQLMESRVKPFSGEVEILPGVRTLPLPGHTPGMAGVLLEQDQVLIAGDGIKNGHEFVLGLPPPAFAGSERALNSYQRGAEAARIIVPGHDNPFRLPITGEVEYLTTFSLEIIFSANPGSEPEHISLPRT